MSSTAAFDSSLTDENIVCVACGTQFPTRDRSSVPTCFICDDPRQYVPPTGQAFTTMGSVRAAHQNRFTPIPNTDGRLLNICSEPKFAIGQRAILVQTAAGNVLWDCLTLLDAETVQTVKNAGGLAAIVISHPHYYSSHVQWAEAFECPVYLAAEDKKWTCQTSPQQQFLTETETDIVPGVKAIKLGGHFPGRLVLLFDGRLLVADTLLTTPAGLGSWKVDALDNARTRPEGMNTFAFLWSIPNSIPLSGEEVFRMWGILKGYEFRSTHGAFLGQDIFDENIKARVLESAKIHTRFIGWAKQESWTNEL